MDEEFRRKRALELWQEGLRYQMEGELDRAVDTYTASIDLFPTAEAFTFRGWAYSMMNRVDEAIEECKKAIEVDPAFGNPYNDIGSYLIAKGKPDEAIEWLEKAKQATRYDPRHFPFMNLGRIYMAKGMILKAIEEFEGALKLQPGEPSCLKSLRRLKAGLN